MGRFLSFIFTGLLLIFLFSFISPPAAYAADPEPTLKLTPSTITPQGGVIVTIEQGKTVSLTFTLDKSDLDSMEKGHKYTYRILLGDMNGRGENNGKYGKIDIEIKDSKCTINYKGTEESWPNPEGGGPVSGCRTLPEGGISFSTSFKTDDFSTSGYTWFYLSSDKTWDRVAIDTIPPISSDLRLTLSPEAVIENEAVTISLAGCQAGDSVEFGWRKRDDYGEWGESDHPTNGQGGEEIPVQDGVAQFTKSDFSKGTYLMKGECHNTNKFVEIEFDVIDGAAPTLPPAAKPPCAEEIVDEVSGCNSISTSIGVINTDPQELIASIFTLLLSLSGGIVVLLIIRAAYQLMTSQGDPEKVKEARERITSAVIGLLFLIFSFVILEVIGVDILHIPGFS